MDFCSNDPENSILLSAGGHASKVKSRIILGYLMQKPKRQSEIKSNASCSNGQAVKQHIYSEGRGTVV